jgi:asparagine synthetase B (glutamine-hydrolysing)
VVNVQVEADENDGQVLFDLLQQNGHDRFLSTLRNIEGPYAFIYYQVSRGFA